MLQSFAAWSFRGIARLGFFGFFGEASHRLLMGACGQSSPPYHRLPEIFATQLLER